MTTGLEIILTYGSQSQTLSESIHSDEGLTLETSVFESLVFVETLVFESSVFVETMVFESSVFAEILVFETSVFESFTVVNLPYRLGLIIYFRVSLSHRRSTHFLSKLNTLLSDT